METTSNSIKTRQVVLGALRSLGAIGTTAALTWVVAHIAALALRPIFGAAPATFAEVIVAGAAVLSLLLLLGQGLSLILGTLGRVPGLIGHAARRVDAALTPAFMRRITALTLGTVVGAGLLPSTVLADAGRTQVSTSVAAPDVSFGAAPAAPVAPSAAAGAPDVAFVPSRPTVRAVPAPDVLGGWGLSQPRGVVVHRGDSLWSIAARTLGPHASDAEIAAEWPRWYAANRDVIGVDPDLILPGTVLNPPAAVATADQ